MSAEFKHKQNNNCFDTIVHLKVRKKLSSIEFFFFSPKLKIYKLENNFQGQTNQLISINSSWELTPGSNFNNISGTVVFVSPYKGYEKGVLVGLLHYTSDLDIHGVAELDLNKKKYAAIIDGM